MIIHEGRFSRFFIVAYDLCSIYSRDRVLIIHRFIGPYDTASHTKAYLL